MSVGRPCAVCTHAERSEIERALLARTPFRAIALQHGMSHTAVARHVGGHMGVNLEEAGLATRESLIANLAYLSSQTLELLDLARQKQSMVAAAALIGAAQKNVELLAKLTGTLDERPQVNVLVMPQWVVLKEAIIRALEVHPQALEDVSRAIAEVSGG